MQHAFFHSISSTIIKFINAINKHNNSSLNTRTMDSKYCAHCNQWIYDSSDDNTYSYEEDSMSWDDWDYNAEQMADPDFISPLKRSRTEAGLSNSSDDNRPRKRRNFGPIPGDDSMQVD